MLPKLADLPGMGKHLEWSLLTLEILVLGLKHESILCIFQQLSNGLGVDSRKFFSSVFYEIGAA